MTKQLEETGRVVRVEGVFQPSVLTTPCTNGPFCLGAMMSEIHWVKLSTAMFDDEKIRVIQSMPSGNEMCLIWIKLIVLAGKTNDNGCIYLTKDIPYTEDMLAKICGHTSEVIKVALHTFQKLGMIEILENNKLLLVNWEKHQNIEGLERVRQLTAERVRKYREKKQLLLDSECNVTVTSGNAIDLDSELELKKKKKAAMRKPFFNSEINQWENVTDEMCNLWERAYPACDIERELTKMAVWLLSNPKKAPKSSYQRFITGWLNRTQDHGGTK